MSTEARTLTYAEYLYPGIIVAERSSQRVLLRDPLKVARNAPEGAYAFRFYDIQKITIDGVDLKSDTMNESHLYFIDAEKMTASDIRKLPGDYKILLSNMESNDWPVVLRARTGNFVPWDDHDIIINTR